MSNKILQIKEKVVKPYFIYIRLFTFAGSCDKQYGGIVIDVDIDFFAKNLS